MILFWLQTQLQRQFFPCDLQVSWAVVQFSSCSVSLSPEPPYLMVLFTLRVSPEWFAGHWPRLDKQMSKDTDDDFYPSEDDLDEDEATQYIIEQSLIQYRKLKGLNPRWVANYREWNV